MQQTQSVTPEEPNPTVAPEATDTTAQILISNQISTLHCAGICKWVHLHHHGLFREDLAGIYTAEIVSAASHLHANDIMHSDLKPDNIILDVDGHAMFTDFGFAKQFANDTRSKTMCGTIEYMSPQVFLGKGYDEATDWWSVEIMLFEMLTRHLPFIGCNRQKIQQKIIIEKAKLPAFLQGKHIPS
ncbi:hypothetical protein HHK36_027212 [Tetracentron sinense]|uniref:Protein kinase domain-containing protein n=1 Tax=Tetracentron sinense TaxID=13715 RepID=A0A834YM93_TETSI|nr:hypothetical protein HHK36_027212 [Tetracentron sinense]